MDEHKPWEQRPEESAKWFARFERYRLMEPPRSITIVFQQEEVTKNRENPRKKLGGDWYEAAHQFEWEKRAAAWDAEQTAERERQIKAEKERILTTRFALMHKRVEALNALASKLIILTGDEDKVWLKEIKTIGTGKEAKRIETVEFNEGLFREIRGLLADIAAEMGERSKRDKLDITLLPKTYIGIDEDEDGCEP